MKSESEVLQITPISIRSEPQDMIGCMTLSSVNVPSVTLAFHNGVRIYFVQGSERVLMQGLRQSMCSHVLP